MNRDPARPGDADRGPAHRDCDRVTDALETEHRERILSKLDDVVDFPDHYLDRLSGVPGYKLRVGEFRLVVDWDRERDTSYVVDVFERKHDYRGLVELREVWGTWRE